MEITENTKMRTTGSPSKRAPKPPMSKKVSNTAKPSRTTKKTLSKVCAFTNLPSNWKSNSEQVSTYVLNYNFIADRQ